MTEAFVLDASVAIAWVHPGQATRQTDGWLSAVGDGAGLVVPALWPLEVANALTVLVKRSKLTADDREVALGWLKALRVRLDHEMSSLAFTTLSGLAATYELSVYDAAYLELAARSRLPLGCKDGPLRAAAQRHGVVLLA